MRYPHNHTPFRATLAASQREEGCPRGRDVFSGLLPGARNLRPPLVSGLLWGLFGWLIYSHQIPTSETASGWPKEAYELAGSMGDVATFIVASVLLFVLGSTLAIATSIVASVVGRIRLVGARHWEWQLHAQRARKRLRQQIVDLQRAVQELRLQAATAEETNKKQRDSALAKQEDKLQQQEADLAAVERNGIRNVLISDSRAARSALGTPSPKAYEGLEVELISGVRRLAIDEELDAAQARVGIDDVEETSYPYNNQLADRLLRELANDPLDALRALSTDLFLALDQERAERDLRLATATPILALGILGAERATLWSLVLVAVAFIVLLRSSVERSNERSRVLNLVALGGLTTPSLKAAAAAGRADWRAHLEHERRAEDAQQRNTARRAATAG